MNVDEIPSYQYLRKRVIIYWPITKLKIGISMSDTSAGSPSAVELKQLTAEIVSAYVAKNSLPMSELPALLQNVHAALGGLSAPAKEEPRAGELKPAVPVKKSITDDYIISLESGQRFKSLKRHLMTAYGMTPQDYRTK